MDALKSLKYLEEKKDYLFPNDKFTEHEVETALLAASQACKNRLTVISYRKPMTVQLISIFPGSLGVDRFYLGDFINGIIKYFTFGGFGVWWLMDIITAQKRCRNSNCEMLMKFIRDFSAESCSENDFDISSLDSDFN